jgi:hypothetical protein
METDPYTLRAYHNPENIDESLVPDGWRFRYADEMNERVQTPCTSWSDDDQEWDHEHDWRGSNIFFTYIVPVA